MTVVVLIVYDTHPIGEGYKKDEAIETFGTLTTEMSERLTWT
jgi:hypothetical protein